MFIPEEFLKEDINTFIFTVKIIKYIEKLILYEALFYGYEFKALWTKFRCVSLLGLECHFSGKNIFL